MHHKNHVLHITCYIICDHLQFLGLTNYPIGVGINGAGEVTIADNHNNFNLSVFSQEGKVYAGANILKNSAPKTHDVLLHS